MKIKIDDYGSWISDELDKSLRPTRSKAVKLIDEAARSLGDARSFYENLARKGEKDMATKKDAASYRAARVIGHAGQEASANLKEIQVPEEANWESLKLLKDGLSSASRSIRTLKDTTSRELSGFYLLDQRSFGGALDRISKSAERLSTFLDGEGSYLQRTRTINGIIESIASTRKEINEKLIETASLAHEQDQTQSSQRELSAKIDQITSEANLHEVLEIERELRKESRAFRSETLAHLQRPLRRLGDLSQRGDFAMGSDERAALAKFLESPYKSFLSNSIGEYVPKILENMKRAIDSGKLGFKPKKTGRVSSQLSQLVGTKLLPEKQQKGRQLVNRRKELLSKQQVKEMYQMRKGLQLKIDETRKHEQEISDRMKSVGSMTEALNKRLSDLLKLAQTKTREYVGRDVELESS